MKTIRHWFLCIGTALVTAVVGQAASPAGTWTANSNGFTTPGKMVIQVSGGNLVTGSFLGNPIGGFWNDAAGKLTFYRAIGGSTSSTPPNSIQIYTGYMHPCSVSSPNGTQCLEGYFESFSSVGGTPSRNVYGWYAFK